MNNIPMFAVLFGRRLITTSSNKRSIWRNNYLPIQYLGSQASSYCPNRCSHTSRSSSSRSSTAAAAAASTTKSTDDLYADRHLLQLQQQQHNQDRPHDVGGNLDYFHSVVDSTTGKKEDDLQPWEQQCHALFATLATKGYVGTDQLRRSIEDLTLQQYADWGYYDKWTAAMVSLLMDKKIISHKELLDALFGEQYNDSSIVGTGTEGIFNSSCSRYQPGDIVQVKSYSSGIEYRRPHIRTPGYVYGVHGRIVDVCGQYSDPSLLAFGIVPSNGIPKVWLYRVQVSMSDLWPEQSTSTDTVSIEIYEHWLQPSDTVSGRDFGPIPLLNHDKNGKDCIDTHHHHYHGHDHDHGSHDDNDEDHEHHRSHQPRPQVEVRAVQREGPVRPGKDLFQALLRIVVDKKGIVTRDEVRVMVQALDDAGTSLKGATFVVEAWMDPSFKERLLKDPAAVGEEIGIRTSNPNAPTVLTVVENTPQVHNLVVCTLCSCYPSSLLGIAPSWYKSSEFRARAVREPRKVLEDFGTILPSGKSICVHDSTADHRYLVLPERPDKTEGWSEQELRKLITRDSMIGVTT
jgi:nitrile hydratase